MRPPRASHGRRKRGPVMTRINETHDPALTSWVASANATGLRLPDPEPAVRRLPSRARRRAVPHRRRDRRPRPRPRAGREDAHARSRRRSATRSAMRTRRCSTRSWRAGPAAWSALRLALSRALRSGAAGRRATLDGLPRSRRPTSSMRCRPRIGDYTDFYASVHHATNIGKLFRPDSPLLPNYKWVPIGYHGRSSTIGVSGDDFRRPKGQTLPPGASEPVFGPSKRLDYEFEVGIFVGTGNERADSDRRGRRPRVRLLPAERLVGARHPGVGVPAARPVPFEELRDDHLAVDRHDRGPRAVSERRGSASPAIRSRCRISTRRRCAATARSTSCSTRRCRRRDRRRTARRRCRCREPASGMRTGASRRWSRITRSTDAG